jgi:hypothetical protein
MQASAWLSSHTDVKANRFSCWVATTRGEWIFCPRCYSRRLGQESPPDVHGGAVLDWESPRSPRGPGFSTGLFWMPGQQASPFHLPIRTAQPSSAEGAVPRVMRLALVIVKALLMPRPLELHRRSRNNDLIWLLHQCCSSAKLR